MPTWSKEYWRMNPPKRPIDHLVIEDGRTMLQECTMCEFTRAMRRLVRMGHDVNEQDNAGYTALHSAAMCGRERSIWVLLTTPGIKPLIRNAYGQTPRMCAKMMGWERCEALLKYAEKRAEYEYQYYQDTMMMYLAGTRGEDMRFQSRSV